MSTKKKANDCTKELTISGEKLDAFLHKKSLNELRQAEHVKNQDSF